MGYSRIVPRRTPAKQDPEKVKRYLKFYDIIKDGPIPVWFFDETGVEANRKPGKVIAPINTRPESPYTGDHIRQNVMGAVNPNLGEIETLVMPYSDTETFQYFLDYFNGQLNGRHCFMIQDNARWHHAKKLNWGKVIPIYLPPYSPNLNAIEPLWKMLKDRMPLLKRIDSEDQLQEIIIGHLRYFINNPEDVKSICRISEVT
jgi:transposase